MRCELSSGSRRGGKWINRRSDDRGFSNLWLDLLDLCRHRHWCAQQSAPGEDPGSPQRVQRICVCQRALPTKRQTFKQYYEGRKGGRDRLGQGSGGETSAGHAGILRTCTMRRPLGHDCSQAESIAAWQTARSLNMGSWMATLGYSSPHTFCTMVRIQMSGTKEGIFDRCELRLWGRRTGAAPEEGGHGLKRTSCADMHWFNSQVMRGR